MTVRRFSIHVFTVVAIYLITALAGIVLFYQDPKGAFEVYKEVSGFLVAAPAAWLAYAFQRRQKYLEDIHEIWKDMVNAVQDAIQYTHLVEWNDDKYAQAQKNFSCVIDELRAVFMNIGETTSSMGLFPFKQLKAIHSKFSEFRSEDFDEQTRERRRGEIVCQWKSLRRSFLNQMSRGIPEDVESPFFE